MNSRFLTMLIIALLLAGGAAWIANRWVESQSNVAQQVSSDVNTVAVVVAASEIPFGSRIEATHIKLLEWPKASVPKDAFNEIQPVIGKVSQRSFVTNEILLKPQIREHLGGSTLSALITEGMRAMSVRVNDVAGVAGFILPGNKVDIIHAKGQGNNTYTLLKNIKVLAIDQRASTEQDKPSVVRALTLEVTPKQSEILVQAMKSGSLQFTLRNPLDDEERVKEVEVEIAEPGEPEPEPKKIIPHSVPQPQPAPSIEILPWDSGKTQKCKGKIC